MNSNYERKITTTDDKKRGKVAGKNNANPAGPSEEVKRLTGSEEEVKRLVKALYSNKKKTGKQKSEREF